MVSINILLAWIQFSPQHMGLSSPFEFTKQSVCGLMLSSKSNLESNKKSYSAKQASFS